MKVLYNDIVSIWKGEKTMQKMMDKMESVLAPLASKIGGNKILKAVSKLYPIEWTRNKKACHL